MSVVIGWREWFVLPDLGVKQIKAKIDTGARSSAIHAINLEYDERDGVPWVKFQIHPEQRNSRKTVTSEARVIDHRVVTSSGGHRTKRPVIATTFTALGQSWDAEVTLASRDTMGFRMLIGREAIRGRFVVDPGRSFLGGKRKRKKKTSKK